MSTDTDRCGASIRRKVAALLQTPARARRAWAIALAAAALAAFLPFVRGVLMGRVLYFRDLAVLFYPYRQYAVDGLRAGELRYWDPYLHEGVPLVYPPLAYPLDVLQALWPGVWTMSSLLALHVPLAAVTLFLLARRFGVSPAAAATGGVAYALGGFVLSTINLYIYVQAAAWAPLVILALRRAATGPPRRLALAAVATALALSSLGVELALQAILVGFVLALRPRRPMTAIRAAAAAALGFGLASPVILVMRANMAAGQRAHGFPVDVVLNQSVHPFTLLQVLVAHLYGDLAQLPNLWWGSNFFDRGFPYIVSLYLGATVLALASTAVWVDGRRSRRLVILAMVALVIALGRWGGLAPVLEALPDSWRALRYPTKAFFTVHLCLALLAAFGLHALSRGRRARTFLLFALGFGLPLLLAPAIPSVFPGPADWFRAHFFPPALSRDVRTEYFAAMLADAARGGGLALAAALVGALILRRLVRPPVGAALIAVIAAGDLLRAGSGLNPMTSATLVRPAPGVAAPLTSLPGRQRIFTCPPEQSRAYWQARRLRPRDHEALTLSTWADTLTPHFNRLSLVPSAFSDDLTSLVPLDRVRPAGVGCGDLPRLVPLLRRGGVSHVLSLDPLTDVGLRRVGEIAPARLAPLRVFVDEVETPLPLRFVAGSVRRGRERAERRDGTIVAFVEGAPGETDGAAGTVRTLQERPDHLAFEVIADRPTAFVVLDGGFTGWRATLDGREVPVLAAGPHRAVWVPAGRSQVTLDYHPRGLAAGLALAVASLLTMVVLWIGWGRGRRIAPRAAAASAR